MDELYFVNIYNEKMLKETLKQISTGKEDVKKRGVVFTNEKTILNLLRLLPENVWSNKNLKWLDPGSGVGNIMIYIFYKLMKHIAIKDIEKRRKHILEQMLYFIEINKDYITIIKQIFCSDRYKLNIHEGSFVSMNIEDDNTNIYSSYILYDIIITNPPYQKPNKLGGSSSKPLYHLFIQRSLELLKQDGYLVAIHPFTWRRKSREIKLINHLLNYQIHYIYTNNNFKEFNKSAIHINYYLLQKCDNIYKSKCENYFNNKYYYSELQLHNKYEFLPILLTEETMSIIDKMQNINTNKLTIKLESKLSSTHSAKNTNTKKDDIFQYKNYHTFSLKKNTNIYRYTKEKHPSHDKHKIIMNFKGGYNIFRPFIDNGKMGITDSALYIDTKDNLKRNSILKLFNSDLFKFILMITSYNYAPNKKIEFHVLNTLAIADDYKLITNETKIINDIVTSV
jgi:tRNA1(Val) A37 N6-methylase TrmN6